LAGEILEEADQARVIKSPDPLTWYKII